MFSPLLNTLPIVLYNAEAQEMIGIFSSPILAKKYIFNTTSSSVKRRNLFDSNISKKKNILNVKIACRRGLPKHIDILGTKSYFIEEKYKNIQ